MVTYGEGVGQTEQGSTNKLEQGKVKELADSFEAVILYEPRTRRKYYESLNWGNPPILKRDNSESDWGADDSAVSNGSAFEKAKEVKEHIGRWRLG